MRKSEEENRATHLKFMPSHATSSPITFSSTSFKMYSRLRYLKKHLYRKFYYIYLFSSSTCCVSYLLHPSRFLLLIHGTPAGWRQSQAFYLLLVRTQILLLLPGKNKTPICFSLGGHQPLFSDITAAHRPMGGVCCY